MKVALVVPGGVDRSGVERVIPCLLWLIERLAREYELHVFSLRQDPFPCRYDLLGARVHNIGARPRRPRALAALVAEHRRGPFHVIHAVWAIHPGVVAAAAGTLLRRPVVLHLTGGDLAALRDVGYGALRSRRGREWLRLAAGGAARLTTPSGSMLERARELGWRAERLPFGVALDRWPERRPVARNGGRPARLLFVGTLNRVKDPSTLLRAAALLWGEGVDFRLDVVGEDILDGGARREARALGLDERVRFHGFVPHPALRDHVAAADLLLVTSLHEADPVVALEAAVVGVPVVGTAVGHIADWAPGAAVAVPVGDAEALASAVADLLADEPRRLRIAEEAHRRATVEDADWTAGRVSAIYREVAG